MCIRDRKYYGEYRKADTAEKKLRQLIEEGQQEAEYIDSVFDALTRAQTNDEPVSYTHLDVYKRQR